MGFQHWIKKQIQDLFSNKSTPNNDEDIIRKGDKLIFPPSSTEPPRIIHHYPKGDSFPQIKEKREIKVKPRKRRMEREQKIEPNNTEKKLEQKPVKKRERKTARKVEEKIEVEQKQKFTGASFKAGDIPSPVYGFKTRDKDKLYTLINAKTKEPELEQPYPPEVEEVIPEPFDLISSEEQEENDTQTDENMIASFLEQIAVAEEVTEQQKEKVDTPPIKVHTERKTEHTKGTINNQARASEPSKRAVPFNVMMLAKDKKKVNVSQNGYQFPPIHLLTVPPRIEEEKTDWIDQQARLLESTLDNFNVKAKVVHVTKGPSVTRFEIQPAPGVKVSKITGLLDDIKLSLAAKDIRMEAPIPGKNAIGIEIPNKISKPVFLREIIRRKEFQQQSSPLTVGLGLDIAGQPVITDLNKMPHGLVAGSTGSGKSVCINSILVSLLYKATPEQVKLLLIDPKMVELAPYNEVPHLISPVITDAKQATAALKWIVLEMERRYELFSQRGTRDISRYNDLYSEGNEPALPYIVVVIDELADLMMVAPQDVEDSICRIAQKARACGIHLLLATQRPSVDVITGLIKANVPTRIAFSVSSQVDSRTIIDMSGAERLLGKGDMLFYENGTSKPVRVQGTFVSDEEIEEVIAFVKKQQKPNYILETEQLQKVQDSFTQEDELFEEACYFVIEQGIASASSLQRRFRIGYNRAARLIDMMESQGMISEAMGSKPRNVLVSLSEFENEET
ncbi:DNA translocase FtsK [Bacillus alkalicellulosilyticus]|uniref:DNA translocase FtsK n=1 Tax=Alkalihalobacterium alkalicellulosilyticum TaxID=1912214 RepID=UPI000995DFE6|nr:DNA translocase FtsK [Bacillus alkalicellulosilyticus]